MAATGLRADLVPRQQRNKDRRLQRILAAITDADHGDRVTFLFGALVRDDDDRVAYLDAGTQSDVAVQHCFVSPVAAQACAFQRGRLAWLAGLDAYQRDIQRLAAIRELQRSGREVDLSGVGDAINPPHLGQRRAAQTAGGNGEIRVVLVED